MFEAYLRRWNLAADGPEIVTKASRLLPVRQGGVPAILKLSLTSDDRRGAALLEWWDGDGAARVFARDRGAVLMERATDAQSLAAMARGGQDDEACRILCHAAAELHRSRRTLLPELVPLTMWFTELWPTAEAHGGILHRCSETARNLLRESRRKTVLHGDLHHGNVLDFGKRGWLAIDPQALIGEREFDFANIFTNPDLDDPSVPIATDAARFERRIEIVAESAGLERQRLLRWILAWTGLSAAWFLNDQDPLAEIDLKVARLTAALLDR